MSDPHATIRWPTELKLKQAERLLAIDYDDGVHFELPAEYLRVESPSAEVQGHGPGQKQTIGGKQSVGIARLEPVGNYAVRLIFTDGHDTGIFSWRYLYELGEQHDRRWGEYLAALATQGLTR